MGKKYLLQIVPVPKPWEKGFNLDWFDLDEQIMSSGETVEGRRKVE